MTYVIGILALFALLAGWVGVQAAYRRFARRHPGCGPWRDQQAGCGACAAADSCGAEQPRER